MGDGNAPGSARVEPDSWIKKIGELLDAARRLLSTRSAIFREELAVKAGFFGRGIAALVLAASFGGLALLLFTAWIAALFTSLLGGPVAGILAAFGLYILIAGLLAWAGVRALSRVKPADFPVTEAELKKDWAAIRAAAGPASPEPPERSEVPARPPANPHDDFEARFRAGSE